MQARFIKGNYQTIDYTPVADVSAGDVIIDGDLTLIAHNDIAAGELGALAIDGGVYEAVKDGTSGPVFALGDWLYWDDSNNEAVASATSNAILGPAVEAAGTSDAAVRFLHVCSKTP